MFLIKKLIGVKSNLPFKKMDNLNKKQIERNWRINEVLKILKQIRKEDRRLNEDEFVVNICEQFYCSERTAKEYIKIARSRLNA